MFVIALGSNAFYELSSLQYASLYETNSKDFVIAARAWGDNVWKHIRRSFTISSINQLFTLWIIFFSNSMILEIFLQKEGIGYILRKYFLDSTQYIEHLTIQSTQFIKEPNLFLAISALVILTISITNMSRIIILKYLMDIRR